MTVRGLAIGMAALFGLQILGMAAAWEEPEVAPPAVGIVVKEDTIDFRHGGELSTRYHFGPKLAKPYFWPVNSPAGVALTRSWPMEEAASGEATDHVHQKSLWFCHGDVIPEGITLKQHIKGVEGVDFWSETKGHGQIVCTKVGKPEIKGNQGKVETFNEWRSADGDKILEEKRTLKFVSEPTFQLLVLDIDLHASVCPVTFGDTKEGSLGVRVRQELTEAKGKGKLTNAEGKVGELLGVWGSQSAWCDDSGPVGDKTIGISVFAHPANPVATCWHSRGYGLMAANPFGRKRSEFPAMKDKTELVKLARGEHLHLVYGILLHQGDVRSGKVDEAYRYFTRLK